MILVHPLNSPMAPHGPDMKPILYIRHKWPFHFHTHILSAHPPPHVCTKGILRKSTLNYSLEGLMLRLGSKSLVN